MNDLKSILEKEIGSVTGFTPEEIEHQAYTLLAHTMREVQNGKLIGTFNIETSEFVSFGLRIFDAAKPDEGPRLN